MLGCGWDDSVRPRVEPAGRHHPSGAHATWPLVSSMHRHTSHLVAAAVQPVAVVETQRHCCFCSCGTAVACQPALDIAHVAQQAAVGPLEGLCCRGCRRRRWRCGLGDLLLQRTQPGEPASCPSYQHGDCTPQPSKGCPLCMALDGRALCCSCLPPSLPAPRPSPPPTRAAQRSRSSLQSQRPGPRPSRSLAWPPAPPAAGQPAPPAARSGQPR